MSHVARGAADVDDLLTRVVDLKVHQDQVIDALAVDRMVAVFHRQAVQHDVAGVADPGEVPLVVAAQQQRSGAGAP